MRKRGTKSKPFLKKINKLKRIQGKYEMAAKIYRDQCGLLQTKKTKENRRRKKQEQRRKRGRRSEELRRTRDQVFFD